MSGNGVCVIGSLMKVSFAPLLFRLWLKSPLRSRAVGTSTFLAVLGTSCFCHSWLKKKNALCLARSKSLGM